MQNIPVDPNPIAVPAPPSSLDAERSVIGALLQDPQTVAKVLEQLTPDDFYSPQHKAVYEAVSALYAASSAVDLMTVGEHMLTNDTLNMVGGTVFLLECVRSVPTTANTQSYVDIVREKSNLRRLIKTAQDIQRMCYSQMDSSASILSVAEASLAQSGSRVQSTAKKPATMRQVMPLFFDQVERNCKHKGVIQGVPTGFYDLDRMLTGLHGGELIIVGGRPAMGKTSFALSVAHFAAIRAKKHVLFFSLEMPREQLASRMVSLHSRVPMQRMRLGTVTDDDWSLIADAVNDLSVDSLVIDDTPSISPTQMRSRIRSAIASGQKPDLVLVDYLGIVAADQKAENRQNEVSAITRQLKAIARELSIPFMVLAQLSRANSARSDKRPVLTDLRETGNIEAEADVVLFVHREGYYNPDGDQTEGVVIVAKQRNGPVGDVPVRWDREIASYANLPGTIVAQYQ